MSGIQLIGLSGRKQSGKTTAAKFLENSGYYRVAFADPIKQMACVLLTGIGVNRADIKIYEDDKERIIPALNVSYRHLLQTLGTEWGRKTINPNIWTHIAGIDIDSVHGGVPVVIEDVRFDNEAAWIRARGGKVVHIVRSTGNSDSHESESGVTFADEDLQIDNNGTLEQLRMNLLFLAGINTNTNRGLIDVGEYQVDYFDWDFTKLEGLSYRSTSLDQAIAQIKPKSPNHAHSCKVMRCVHEAKLTDAE